MLALIDGDPSAEALSVFDGAVLRGDGCFEAIRSYHGRAFAFGEHYARLIRSAHALGIPVPAADRLRGWVGECAASGGDGIVRIVLTRGGSVPGSDSPSRCVVLWHPLPADSGSLRLMPVAAPWHPGGEKWELAGVKTISYAPNQAASRRAVELGGDDALLISREGYVLEGPTFAVAWVVDGSLETPSLDLGILESITRRFVLDDCSTLAISVREGRFPLSRLERAVEVMALSTVKEVTAVTQVGSLEYTVGPFTEQLLRTYRIRTQETPAQVTTGS